MELCLLCVLCAGGGALRPAAAVQEGASVCLSHRGSSAPAGAPPAATGPVRVVGALGCLPCAGEGRERRAWFVVGGESLCIRHTSFAATGSDGVDDDMAAHDLAHAVYQALGALGVEHAY